MSRRAFILASVLVPVLLSPAWAQDAPVATAPIPPAIRAAPDAPAYVAPKPYLPPAQAKQAPTSPAAAAGPPPHPAAKSAEKPAPRVKEADQKKSKPAADKPAKTAAKAEKKAEKKIEKKVAASAKSNSSHDRVVVQRRWVVRDERPWAPPPPFGPSWYGRYNRGPMAYGPYGGGMRVPPPPWAD